jgi:T5SS/PEP-CTERM-associated repeat protein
MTVGAGGTVISAGYDGTPAAIIGDGNTGGVTIDGVGARWVATGEVEIGGSATGRLLVEAGGTLATGDGTYGFVAGAGAMGTVEVTGAGSRLTNSGSFMVGDDGPGTLGVLAGAVVSTTVPGGVAAQGAMIGAYASGRVTVSGTGSTWSIFGQLEIGFYATGNLAIGTDGKVTASALQLDSAGTLTLSGAGTALQISGNATFDESSAAGVSIGTGSLLSIAGTAAVNGQIAMAGGTLTVGKPLSLTYGGQIAGRGTVQAARLSNAGTIASSAGTLSFIGNISGTGQMQVGAASTLRLQGAVAAGSKAVFEAATGTLQLAAPAGFAGSIADFVKGDVIDLSGIVASSLTYSGQKLTVHESNGSTLGLLFSAAYTSASFAPPASDGHGGTLITHA